MRQFSDLRLILVTDAALTARRGLLETVRAAVAGGVTSVQLRDKAMSDAEMVPLGRMLMEALAPAGVRLMINDRVAVAAALGADLHIGQADCDPTAARAAIGPAAILGLSVTRQHEVATVDPALVDYVGLGPVFATSTKADAAPPLGLEGFRKVGGRLPLPFVAIGGVDAANAGSVIAAGATGIAVVSAICAAADPEMAAAGLRRAVDGARP